MYRPETDWKDMEALHVFTEESHAFYNHIK